MKEKIAIVEINADNGQLRKDILESSGFKYTCFYCATMDQLEDLLKHQTINTLLIEKTLLDQDVYKKIKKIKIQYPTLHIIAMADEINETDIQQAQCNYVDEFVPYTDEYPIVINAIEKVIQ